MASERASELEMSYTLWRDGLPVLSVDGLDASGLEIELWSRVGLTEEELAQALGVVAAPSDVSLVISDGSQLEVGSRPI